MPSYLHPGVYLEEIPSGSKPIEGVSTSVAAFVGSARKGPVGVATLIGKLDDYLLEFGSINSEDDAMGLAVQSFYLNGGGAAYICRLAGAGSLAASEDFLGEGAVGGASTAFPVLIIAARNEGDWGNDVYVQINKEDLNSLTFEINVGHLDKGVFKLDESFQNLSMREADDNYALTTVNGASAFISLALGDSADPDETPLYQAATLTGGALNSGVATYFSAAFITPRSLTLELNGLGAKQITLNPADLGLTGVHDDDGQAIAAAIVEAVNALSTADAYQGFDCSYNDGGPTNRFLLTSAQDDSNTTILVYGGTLAELLRIDPLQVAKLVGTDVSARDFSDAVTGLPGITHALTIILDNYAAITIELDVAALDLSGDNGDDGDSIATAIQHAVNVLGAHIPALLAFSCDYDGTRFTLASGSSSSRVSNLSVAANALSTLLGITGSAISGRQVEQGSAQVMPLHDLGTLEQGVQLLGGVHVSPTSLDYSAFYSTVLRKVRDVSIIVLPDEQWGGDGSGNAVVSQTLAHCESTMSRVLIIDPPANLEFDQAATVTGLGLPTSTYSVLYYPWLQVANPLYHPDKNPTATKTLSIPPSAVAAGMWAKIDGKRGVWKAPAGVEAQLRGVAGLDYIVEDLEQDQLNPLGVNCIRKLPNFGSVIWGSRTLATKADPEWRYVPVRRTAIFIEQSIYNGIQWAVFEPNDYPLWGSLRSNISSFMNGLFRSGAFQGATADDAYFVRCGLGDTMTQGDIDRGQVIVIVGFAPLKPAEFVIVRIQQKVGQQ